ncbi:MAG: tetratricopeptide repeat protein [Paracoccaceae bacterium]
MYSTFVDRYKGAAPFLIATCFSRLGRPCKIGITLMAMGIGLLVWNPNDVDSVRNATIRLACGAGSGKACVNHGVQYGRGDGVRQDYAKAAKYYLQACDLDVPEGCSYLGDALVGGRGVDKDLVLAADYQKRACDAGILRACSVLGDLYLLKDEP